MKVLIVGGGGREHALAWKVAQSRNIARVYVAPGNAGTAREQKVENVDIKADDLDALVAFAQEQAIDLTIVGPEAPLVAGIVDHFQEADLKCFGPDRAGAQLEGSKSFTKDFLHRHRIPTAGYATFTDLEPALDYLRACSLPVVIKADGLAAGKGVVIAHDLPVAESALQDMLAVGKYGAAGQRVVIEEFLLGEEASYIVMATGEDYVPLASSQDHKARDDGDRGPNTGGMGAYSPAPVVTPDIDRRIRTEVIEPTLRGLMAEGIHYRGFLYAGLMIAPDGTPKVLEFNCRFGDPETQPILMRLQSDLAAVCDAACEDRLRDCTLDWDPRIALGVVLAAGGYPESVRTGDVISGLDSDFPERVKVFHAGTALRGTDVVTAGGRVLCVTALGDDIRQAQSTAYAAVGAISWPGMYYRGDIGYRALINRE